MIRDLALAEVLKRGVDAGSPETVRMAFARGELPLSPRDRLTTLARLLEDPADRVRNTARQTLAALPAEFLFKAFGDKELHELLIDLVVLHHAAIREVVTRALSHPNVGPATLARFASSDDPTLLSLVAENQRVLDREPLIALRLLENPHLEPGVRGRLHSLYVVAKAPGPEGPMLSEPEAEEPDPEIAGATGENAEEAFDVGCDDVEEFSEGEEPLGEDSSVEETSQAPQEPEWEVLSEEEFLRLPPELFREEAETTQDGRNLYQLVQSLSVAEKIKLATLGSKSARRLLCRDSNRIVVNAVVHSPKIQEDEIQALALDKTMPDDVIVYIFTRKDWMKNYGIRHALVQNPKTPIPRALRLLETLGEKDLRGLAKSRNVSSVISTAALRLIARRTQKK
jgi:hypothetical protein